MNKYLEKHLTTEHDRKPIFEEVLSYFGGHPIRILEIGTMRDLAPESIYGDGFSTFFFVDYIKKYGGSLKIVDVSEQSLANCKYMLGDFIDGVDVEFVRDEGVNHIDDSFSFCYLDGGDEVLEMTQELSKINRARTMVLCDDFESKGFAARADHPDFVPMRCKGGHLMAFYPLKN